MSRKIVNSAVFVLSICAFCAVVECSSVEENLEARGKDKHQPDIGLLVYLADLIIKKVFIIKLIFGFVLFCLIHKAGYFISWIIHYLKEEKPHHHQDYSDHHHPVYYEHHQPYDNYGPGPYKSGPYKKSWKS